jgi:hypothetical protein
MLPLLVIPTSVIDIERLPILKLPAEPENVSDAPRVGLTQDASASTSLRR